MQIFVQNPHIFKHGDVSDMDREEEREKAVQMMLTYHKNRKMIFDPLRYHEDPHALAITAHATYNFDAGFSVKNDISFLLYWKTLYAFHTS